VEISIFEVTCFATNCLVVQDSGEALVVDPGDAVPELLESLEGYKVRTILNTHGHCDHCGGNGALTAYTGAELACHAEDVQLIRSIEAQGAMFGVPFPPSPEPTRLLVEGDRVHVGRVEFTIFHTPGHTPGHIVLVGDGVAVVGDVLFAGSIGRTDLPGGNYERLLESIRTRLLNLPDETIVYPGHGPTTSIGAEREMNPYVAGLEPA